ncbi:MAG: rod shape-determining protein RodA [Actinobacteria bacterium]|nr:MAG: rod shape-determining protein RodA [Actinomycetota bacterium]
MRPRSGCPRRVIEAVDTRARGLRGRRNEAVEAASVVRRLDWILLAATGALVAYGLWAIAGITRHDVTGNANYYVVRQGVYASLGLLALVVAVFVDPEYYRRYRKQIYVGTLGLMVIVLLAGAVTRGSKRWLDLGFFKFQPSEFGKLLLVLFLAGMLADRAKRIGDSKTVLTAIGFAAGPIFLVFVQPDLGTAMVYTAALAGVLFLAGTRWTHLAILGGATLLAALLVLWILPAAGHPVLKSYQQQRVVGFMHRNDDPRGATYNVTQSINAVGAGGEHATDFVFASIAEQRGFVGVSILLLLYLLVIWRALKVMAGARDAFSAIAAGGIVVALLFQVFINVGMTVGIAPITGIPLPFVSVGGSAMIANLLAIGVLEAIYVRGTGRRRRY